MASAYMPLNQLVSVTIVTYNSGRFIKRCLESVLEQKYANMEVVIVDNASTDGTPDILEPFADRCRIYYNDKNLGFAAAQNQAIELAKGDWILTLNPDVLLQTNFIQALVDAGNLDPKVGTVCGKLLSIRASFDLPEKQLIDSTGIYFTPMLRHLDRGSLEVDQGHYTNHEYVFGATAAAALYRRTMIEDIAILVEFFDSDFFVYREDADVAWRAQLFGWRCLYTPLARGYHVRAVLPGNRRVVHHTLMGFLPRPIVEESVRLHGGRDGFTHPDDRGGGFWDAHGVGFRIPPPRDERDASASEIIARLRPPTRSRVNSRGELPRSKSTLPVCARRMK